MQEAGCRSLKATSCGGCGGGQCFVGGWLALLQGIIAVAQEPASPPASNVAAGRLDEAQLRRLRARLAETADTLLRDGWGGTSEEAQEEGKGELSRAGCKYAWREQCSHAGEADSL